MTELDIIYCYRDRDLLRVKNSLESLSFQTSKNFRVIFVDYGSSEKFSSEIKELCGKYEFCNYTCIDTEGKMWNRGDALNYGILLSSARFVFTADVDLVFKKNFTSVLLSHQDEHLAKFFAVGYLDASATGKISQKKPEGFTFSVSEDFALGMGLFSRKMLNEVNGYNSFYALWGQEDNDLKLRLEKAGFQTYFEKNVHLLHQYHKPAADSAEIPDGWVQYMKDYYQSYEHRPHSFRGLSSINIPLQRPAKKIFRSGNDFYQEINGRELFLRHTLINKIATTEKGKELSFLIQALPTPGSSGVFKIAKHGANLLRFFGIPLRVIPFHKTQYLTVTEIKHQIYFTVKCLEGMIEDYYIMASEKSVRLIIVKK
jgi:hypothetical protein